MELWQAIILGLVEGITEYLPVSSTGHLILASELMGLRGPSAKQAIGAFEIVIQGGAILAVLGLYFPRFVQMLRGVLGRDNAGFLLFVNIIIAMVPALVLGVLFHSWIEKHLFSAWTVCIALIVGGVYMMIVDTKFIMPRRHAGKGAGGLEVTDLTPGKALLIGSLQCIAMWPGISRSMMTITGGVFAGLRPAAAAEFSFLLGMPTLLAATAYALYKNISQAHKTGGENLFDTLGWTPVIVGMIVAAVSAAVAVKWLVGFLNRHGLMWFGVYRIVAGIVILILASLGLVAFEPW
jgi:undecaprenyl-diphosphatase